MFKRITASFAFDSLPSPRVQDELSKYPPQLGERPLCFLRVSILPLTLRTVEAVRDCPFRATPFPLPFSFRFFQTTRRALDRCVALLAHPSKRERSLFPRHRQKEAMLKTGLFPFSHLLLPSSHSSHVLGGAVKGPVPSGGLCDSVFSSLRPPHNSSREAILARAPLFPPGSPRAFFSPPLLRSSGQEHFLSFPVVTPKVC